MLLRTLPLAAIGVALLVLGVFAWQGDPATTVSAATNCDVPSTNWDTDQQEFFALLNQERANNGLVPLKPSPTLNTAATWLSQKYWYSGTNSPIDPLGRGLAERLKDCDYPGWNGPIGESRAPVAGHIASNVLSTFMNSAPDRANILGDFKVIGIGWEHGYWTVDFGKYDDSGLPDGPPPNWTPTPTSSTTATATPTATPTVNGRKRAAFAVMVAAGGPE
jgi:hypothetical protein